MKLTIELQRELLETARTGAFKSTVAEYCGVPEAWLDEVIVLGLTTDGPYSAFAREFAKTEAGLEIEVLKSIKLAMTVDPSVGFEYLAKRFPKRWGPKAAQTGTVAELRPTQLQMDEQLELIRALFESRPPALLALLSELGFNETTAAGLPKSLPEPVAPVTPSKAQKK